MFSKINLLEIYNKKDACYKLIFIPKISRKKQSIIKHSKSLDKSLDKSLTNEKEILIIPIWIQKMKLQKINTQYYPINYIKILLNNNNQLLSIPFKNRKNIKKHIRIYSKKLYGLSKSNIHNIDKLTDNCYIIFLNSPNNNTNIENYNKNILWRTFSLVLKNITINNNIFKQILQTQYYDTTFYYNTIKITLTDIYQLLSKL